MRTRAHILEEESRQAFKATIPSEWVVRPQIPDYGLDEQVQIFKNGQLTNFYFFVQIKGSDGIPATQNSPSYSFKTERLLQYIENPLPVLLVLYDSEGERLFYEWIHSVFRDDSNALERKLKFQKTVTVNFTNRLDNLDMSILEREVRHQYFWLGHINDIAPKDFRISVSMNLHETENSEILERLNQWIMSHDVTRFIKITNEDTPDGTIQINSSPLSIDFFDGQTSKSIKLRKPDVKETFFDSILSTVKIMMAVIVANCGLSDISLDMVRRIVIEEKSLSPEAVSYLSLPTLARIYAAKDRVAEALLAAEQLMKNGYINPARNLASSALHGTSTPKYYNQQYRRFLKTAIDFVEEDVTKATLHYSLANNLRYDSYFKEAVSHYNQASKYYSEYRNRSYWWAEVGGCLFLKEKYAWAERCYEKAIELGEKNIPVIALLADTYIHEGKFSRAKEEFEKYFRITKNPFAEFILKHWLSDLLFSLYGDSRRNQRLAMTLAEKAIEENSPQQLVEALKIDPLCGFAWFNHAVDKSKETQGGSYKEWLVTSIIQNWDVESWANSIISMISSTEPPCLRIMPAVFFFAFKLHGENLKKQIKRVLVPQLSSTEIEDFISRVSELVEDAEQFFPEHKPFTIRYFTSKQQSSESDSN